VQVFLFWYFSASPASTILVPCFPHFISNESGSDVRCCCGHCLPLFKTTQNLFLYSSEYQHFMKLRIIVKLQNAMQQNRPTIGLNFWFIHFLTIYSGVELSNILKCIKIFGQICNLKQIHCKTTLHFQPHISDPCAMHTHIFIY
jgi:lipid-A-disaccharide synthase-like uncharacterized protein